MSILLSICSPYIELLCRPSVMRPMSIQYKALRVNLPYRSFQSIVLRVSAWFPVLPFYLALNMFFFLKLNDPLTASLAKSNLQKCFHHWLVYEGGHLIFSPSKSEIQKCVSGLTIDH